MTHAIRTFTVYHAASTIEKKTFRYRHHAETYARKLNANNQTIWGNSVDQTESPVYAVAPTDYYRDRVVYTVTVKNLLSGREYQEASNTPGYCSPSREAYWTM
jgi:hypothetical protein